MGVFTLACALLTLSVGVVPRVAAVPEATLPVGKVTAVYELLDRLVPNQRGNFTFGLAPTAGCGSTKPPCYTVTAKEGDVSISGSGANEISAGLGYYLREHCSMVIGWPRGGGSRVAVPAGGWPDAAATRRRAVPWSYAMNVCTHSYSLVWYGWEEWTAFIDWMALSGINNYLAETGQEEIAYKVLTGFGLNDTTIRNWFNGPALLTWSRGQNEYGGDIAGPLPRSWMKAQWALQKKIVARTRELGMVGQLPAFQAAVPAELRALLGDKNMTAQGNTAWIDALDPVFLKIADKWMETMIADFGTDHWYQLDGYFNGGTAPWYSSNPTATAPMPEIRQGAAGGDGAMAGDARMASMSADGDIDGGGRTLSSPTPPPPPPDPSWAARGQKAWDSLSNTDPDAIWSYQGWAILNAEKSRGMIEAFVGAVPAGRFNVIDMAFDGRGEWDDWVKPGAGAASAGQTTAPLPFFGANFIWTSLHTFGGMDSVRGNLSRANDIPFRALHAGSPDAATGVWGSGFTPEGIDQNPAYYEFIIEQNWRSEPVPDIPANMVARAHRRYGLAAPDADVTAAWTQLAEGAYTLDLWGMDSGGVTHIPGTNYNNFAWEQAGTKPCVTQHCTANYSRPVQPTPMMCTIWKAWGSLIAAGPRMDGAGEPWNYDLVNVGHEVLNQLALPVSVKFNNSLGDTATPPVPTAVNEATTEYVDLLLDLDELVNTDTAFQVGGWIEQAKALAAQQPGTDCVAKGFPEITSCEAFYEWNAKVQITTWDPTPKGAAHPGKDTVDYASKHWSGLIADYYAERVRAVQREAIKAAAAGEPLHPAAVDRAKAALAYAWTTSRKGYPTAAVGDTLAVSTKMHHKYAKEFAWCDR